MRLGFVLPTGAFTTASALRNRQPVTSESTPAEPVTYDDYLRMIQSDPTLFNTLTTEQQALVSLQMLEALKQMENKSAAQSQIPSTASISSYLYPTPQEELNRIFRTYNRPAQSKQSVPTPAKTVPIVPNKAIDALKFAMPASTAKAIPVAANTVPMPANTARTASEAVVNPQAAVPVANPKGGIPVVQESAIQPVVAKQEETAPVIVVPVKEEAAAPAPVQQQAKPKPAGRPTYNGTISDDQITRGLKNAADIWKGVYKNAPVRWQKMTDAGISNDDQAIAQYIVNRQDAEKKNAAVRQALENTISSIPTKQITIAETKAPSADILIPKRAK